jgi:hypothetical protein
MLGFIEQLRANTGVSDFCRKSVASALMMNAWSYKLSSDMAGTPNARVFFSHVGVSWMSRM